MMKPTLTVVLLRPNAEADAAACLRRTRELKTFRISTESLELLDEILAQHEAAGVDLNIEVPTTIAVEKAVNLRELGLDLRLVGRGCDGD